MKYVLVTLVLLVTIAMAQTQGVYGYVSKGGLEVAAGATVRLEYNFNSWYDETTTDSTGYYSIETPYTGSHRIKSWKWYGAELWSSDWEDINIPSGLWVRKEIVITN